MPRLFLFAWIALVTARVLPAQSPPTLDETLAALQSTLVQYLRDVPNLYCDEHVVSNFLPHAPAQVLRHTTVDSIFRIRRPSDLKTLADFKESRETRLVDGRPIASSATEPELPLLVSGVFSNALSLFSPALLACLQVNLAPSRPGELPNAFALDFVTRRVPKNDSCATIRPTSGRALIDRTTLRPLSILKRTAHYPIFENYPGTWTWSVEYASTQIAGRTLWLPSHIHSSSISDESGAEWTFDATYTNYHLLTVSSHILPAQP